MYMKSNYLTVTAFAALTILLSACGSDTESTIDTPMSEVDLGVQASITNTVIPAINNFSQDITELNASIDSFCSNVNEANLTLLQTAWKESFISWYQLLPFQLGPLVLTDDNAAILNYIDFYRNSSVVLRTSNLNDINSGLNALMSGAAITETSLTNTLSKNVGLLVLETAIYSTLSDSTTTSDIVTEFSGPSKKCDIIQALGYALNERTSFIKSQWTMDYRGTGENYLNLFTNNELENFDYGSSFDNDNKGTPASETLIVALQEFLDFVGNSDSLNELTRFSSDVLWDAYAASIGSIESILDQSANTELTLYAIMKSNGYEQDVETIQTSLTFIKQAIADKNTVDFIAAAKALDGNFKTSVIDGLNINKGLTFADGDS